MAAEGAYFLSCDIDLNVKIKIDSYVDERPQQKVRLAATQ